MNKPAQEHWYELDEQMSRTPSETDTEGIPGEHIKLLAPLNKFGFNPMSKHAALVLAEKLLNEGWEGPTRVGQEDNGRSVSANTFLPFQPGDKKRFYICKIQCQTELTIHSPWCQI